MSTSATILIMTLGGALTAIIVAGVALTILERKHDPQRRHWQVLESEMHV